jgi:protein KIBRA
MLFNIYAFIILPDMLTSVFAVNSTMSISSKYDPDLLKADVEMARKRVGRLKMELDQIHTDMRYTEKGLHTLSA